ncbi:MAG: RluA family pseudouridine synthase [Devosiaceae bacterium]|nr:RluA family pseudouridine synthase [Devosiaceae bacterium]
MLQKENTYIVDNDNANLRLDIFLSNAQSELSRTRIKQLILEGVILINDKKITEPKYKVKLDDEVFFKAPPPIDPTPKGENIALDIIFEDDQVIVINKPVGMVVHPAPGSLSGTLVNALINHCGESFAGIGGVKRPGIVHRLDKDTSGIMVVAKTQRAHNHLSKQFADHGRTGPLKRSYIAFCWGKMALSSSKIDIAIGRDKFNRLKQGVRKDGKEAITHYKTSSRYAGEGWEITKMICQLETGRTHQIRVHMAYIKHPLIADPLYASGFATKAKKLPDTLRNIVEGLNRQALHAAILGFEHPTNKQAMLFEAGLPSDMASLEQALEQYNLV